MFPTQATITVLSERIRAAYVLRYPRWSGFGISARVWETAAGGLCLLNRNDPSYPIDPELFVACQPLSGIWPDPWSDLAPPASLRRYQRAIRQIVRRLHSELRKELRKAEKQLIRGVSIDRLLDDRAPTLSPLGSYVLAHQAGRDDLIVKFRHDAERQHLACPLYRQACLTLLPDGLYPEPSCEFDPLDVDVDAYESEFDNAAPCFSQN